MEGSAVSQRPPLPHLARILSPEKALIFRITHYSNIAWILKHGIHSRTSDLIDHEFIPIGSTELIEKRSGRRVDVEPGGTLDDYVAFYFTPQSPMLYNVITGVGVQQRRPEDIVFLVSSLRNLAEKHVPFVYTNAHAYSAWAEYYSDIAELGERVDFDLLRTGDFRRDEEHPERFDYYQAEALAHKHVPVDALVGLGCYNRDIKARLEQECANARVRIPVAVREQWYFRR